MCYYISILKYYGRKRNEKIYIQKNCRTFNVGINAVYGGMRFNGKFIKFNGSFPRGLKLLGFNLGKSIGIVADFGH